MFLALAVVGVRQLKCSSSFRRISASCKTTSLEDGFPFARDCKGHVRVEVIPVSASHLLRFHKSQVTLEKKIEKILIPLIPKGKSLHFNQSPVPPSSAALLPAASRVPHAHGEWPEHRGESDASSWSVSTSRAFGSLCKINPGFLVSTPALFWRS